MSFIFLNIHTLIIAINGDQFEEVLFLEATIDHLAVLGLEQACLLLYAIDQIDFTIFLLQLDKSCIFKIDFKVHFHVIDFQCQNFCCKFLTPSQCTENLELKQSFA